MAVLFYDDKTIPTEEPMHMLSHLFFWAAMAILIFVTKNPVCAIGLFVTIFFSVAYHLALSFTTKSEKEIENKVKWANLLSVFDYVGIASGVTIALVWNQHVLVMPSLASWLAFAFMVLFFLAMTFRYQHNRWFHALWHLVAITPLMVYAAVDLKETEDYHGETVKTAAIALLVIAGLLIVLCAVLVWRWMGRVRKAVADNQDLVYNNPVYGSELRF